MRVRVAVPLRYDDLEGHPFVSAPRIAALLSEARVRTVLQVGADQDGIVRSVVVRNELEFLRPIRYSLEAVEVHLWVPRIGRASASIHSEVWSEDPGREKIRSAIAITTIVFTDAATGRARAIPEVERAAFADLYDEPLAMHA